MMSNVNQGKGLGLDGVCDDLFSLKKNPNRDPGIEEENWKKIEFCRSLLRKEYWET